MSDLFVANLDPACNPLWAKSFGDAAAQDGGEVGVDANGNIYLSVANRGTIDFGGGPLTTKGDYDIAIAKLDPNGNYVWSRIYGDAGYQIADIQVDASGNVVLAGPFNGSLNFGGSTLTAVLSTDVYLAKIDANGSHIFSEMFTGTGTNHTMSDVALNAAGTIAVTGLFAGTLDLGGGPLQAPATDAGQFASASFVASYSSSGQHLWSKAFPGSGYSVTIDPSGNVTAELNTSGAVVDFGTGTLINGPALVSFSSTGAARWARGFSDTVSGKLTTDASGRIAWHGDFLGTVGFGGPALTSAGGYDAFLAMYAADGTWLFSERYGDAADQGVAFSTAITPSGDVVLFGSFKGSMDLGVGGTLQDSDSTTTDLFVAQLPLHPVSWKQVNAGIWTACGLGADDIAYCWGSNPGTQGDGTVANSVRWPRFAARAAQKFDALSVSDHVCGLAGGALFCWGPNDVGQTGGSSSTCFGYACQTTPLAILPSLRFAKVAAGRTQTCAITPAGALYCWGSAYGAPGATTNLVAGTYQSVSSSQDIVCAIDLTGAVHCLGTNAAGFSLNAQTFRSVSTDWKMACGVGTDGNAYCWGDNDNCSLGIGSTGGFHGSPTLVAVPGSTPMTDVQAGCSASCALSTGGTVYCWGTNAGGALGLGALDNNPHPAPQAVPGLPPMATLAVSNGGQWACGLSTMGERWCWGGNYYGQLSDGTTTTRPGVVRVP